jgi:shikimate kinase
MLVRQAALAQELWTGEKAPIDVMRRAALSALVTTSPEKTNQAAAAPIQCKTNVALIGFMGAGKSSVGKAVARKMGRPFIDLDTLVEKRAGKSISRIFKEDGEPAFRKLEKAATAEVARKAGQVIACGGGVLLDPSNAAGLKNNAVLIYLKASNEAIRKRVSTGAARPLLINSDAGDITSLLAARLPLYEKSADITLDTSRLGIERTADKIIERLGEYEGFRL